MSRAMLALGLVAWAGGTVLLSSLRVFNRVSLTDRLRPYLPSAPRPAGRTSTSSFGADSLREVLGPLAEGVGMTITRVLGVSDDLAVRLRRAHSPHTVSSFRVRQLSRAGLATALPLAVAVGFGFGPVAALAVSLGGGLLTFLMIEQSTIAASNRYQQRVAAELPVVAEQLGMLLGAGFSLSSSMARTARRGSGICADELGQVGNRIRQGLTEVEALSEWAELAALPELDRLVRLLAMNRQAGDLGRLIAEESRSMRREAHRKTIEVIERRSQMVWIPVTVATLVPGVMVMAVPFVSVLQQFSAL